MGEDTVMSPEELKLVGNGSIIEELNLLLLKHRTSLFLNQKLAIKFANKKKCEEIVDLLLHKNWKLQFINDIEIEIWI
jgi:hypothetical protein